MEVGARGTKTRRMKMDCKICGAKNIGPSMGGPDICGACDCGMWPDGRKWSFREYALICREGKMSDSVKSGMYSDGIERSWYKRRF